jgi:hypothetical protein
MLQQWIGVNDLMNRFSKSALRINVKPAWDEGNEIYLAGIHFWAQWSHDRNYWMHLHHF